MKIVGVESEDDICEADMLSPLFDVVGEGEDGGKSDGELLVELSNRVLLAKGYEASHIVLTTPSICEVEESAEQLCQP